MAQVLARLAVDYHLAVPLIGQVNRGNAVSAGHRLGCGGAALPGSDRQQLPASGDTDHRLSPDSVESVRPLGD
jgi:hypothetical protein